MLALAALVDVAAILDPCLAHSKNLVEVALVEVHCQSSQPYSHPCHQNLAFQFRMEYLTCPQVADDQRLIDPVARVDRVVSPSAVEVDSETLDAALEGHH
jgi:hypothetical protein